MTAAYPHNEQAAAQQMREATAALRKLFPAMFMFIPKDKGAQASVEAGEATRRTLAVSLSPSSPANASSSVSSSSSSLAAAITTRTLAATTDFHASVDDVVDINMRNKKNG